MVSDLSQSIHNLAWGTLIHLHRSEPGDGFIFSPFSITIAIGMLAGAADPDLQAQLCLKLGIPNPSELAVVFEDVTKTLSSGTKTSLLETANAIFVNNSITVSSDFVGLLKSFAAETTKYPDLSKETAKINAWISQKTNGKIANMLNPISLRKAEVVLINALAFKGTWKQAFDSQNTRKQYPFHISENKTKEVEMMFHFNKPILVQSHKTYTVIRLPYKMPDDQRPIFFQAYLPSEDEKLEDFLTESRQHDRSFLSTIVPRFGLPRLRSETSQDLTSLLESLGYSLQGQWPALSSEDRTVTFDAILHKAVIEVDEAGTKAAAATAIVARRGRPTASPPVKDIVFDRPFVYCVIEESGIVLFAGLYT